MHFYYNVSNLSILDTPKLVSSITFDIDKDGSKHVLEFGAPVSLVRAIRKAEEWLNKPIDSSNNKIRGDLLGGYYQLERIDWIKANGKRHVKLWCGN